MSKHEIIDEETEWAVLYGDGEAEPFGSPYVALERIKDLRGQIADGILPARDYEPLRVAGRKVQTVVSKWKSWKS